MTDQLPAGICTRCDGEGYVCILCEGPPTDCECYDAIEEEYGEADLNIEVKRCPCNPRPKKGKVVS